MSTRRYEFISQIFDFQIDKVYFYGFNSAFV